MKIYQVTRKSDDALKVILTIHIKRPAHVIPKGDSNNLVTAWWINSYIDLTIWNTVTNDTNQAMEGKEKGRNRTRGR